MTSDNNIQESQGAEESRIQHLETVTRETANQLVQDWRRVVDNAMAQTEQFTKDKPLVALAASFAAGVVLAEVAGLILRRRS